MQTEESRVNEPGDASLTFDSTSGQSSKHETFADSDSIPSIVSAQFLALSLITGFIPKASSFDAFADFSPANGSSHFNP